MNKTIRFLLLCVLLLGAGYGVGLLMRGDEEDSAAAAAGISEKDAAGAIQLMRTADRDCSLKDAVMHGNIRVVLRRLRTIKNAANKRSLSALQDGGYNLLHLAAVADRADVIYLLLHRGANATIESADGKKPADMATSRAARQACRYGERIRRAELDAYKALKEKREDVVLKAIKEGVDVNMVTDDAGRERPMLFEAIVNGCSERMVQELVNAGADVKECFQGMTSLHYAAQNNRADLVNILVKAGVDIYHRRWGKDTTALHEAVYYNCPEVLKALIPLYDKTGLNIYAGSVGYPVTLAIGRDRYECLVALIEAGVDPNDKLFSSKSSLLHFAAELNRPKCLEYLLRKGADKNARDKDGRRPFDVAQGDCAKMLRP